MTLPCRSLPVAVYAGGAEALYRTLLSAPHEHLSVAAAFLDEQLRLTRGSETDLPMQPQVWPGWLEANARTTAKGFAAYLQRRRQGAPREHLRNRAHALHFLQAVAPTKWVDGAWLYGVLAHADDTRLLPLVHTCLEEMGHGIAARNHVLIYQRLLDTLGCEMQPALTDAHYIQGAVQLALGYQAERYLPELIGYNLGYELPPLHLLITTHELQELGIDPAYFRLHVTIDNASSGHARKALQALSQLLPQSADRQAFLHRVRAGYRLNEAGLSNRAILDSFDLDRELLAMLERKRPFGQQMHSEHCRLDGRTINQWLASPEHLPGFVQALQDQAWVVRGSDPANSRFWRLVEGDQAVMFGVFTSAERQLLYDWIADDWTAKPVPRTAQASAPLPAASPVAQTDFDTEERALRDELRKLTPAERTQHLFALMAPHLHWTPAGLLATRLFSQQMGIEP